MESIDLPFTRDSLFTLVQYGAADSSPYTHYAICSWCWEFVAFASGEETLTPEMVDAIDIAYEIDMTWDEMLANTLSPEEIRQRTKLCTLDDVMLPKALFQSWLAELQA